MPYKCEMPKIERTRCNYTRCHANGKCQKSDGTRCIYTNHALSYLFKKIKIYSPQRQTQGYPPRVQESQHNQEQQKLLYYPRSAESLKPPIRIRFRE